MTSTTPSRSASRLGILLRTRAALGLTPVAAPAVIFIPLGTVLGPQALGFVSEDVLAHFDTVVTVALTMLGVFAGLALDPGGRGARRLLLAAGAEALVTLAIVSGTLWLLAGAWGMALDEPMPVVALTLGICAATSAAQATGLEDDPVHRVATRVADLDDVVPIVLGGIVLASVRTPGLDRALWLGGATCLIGLAVGAAGWLLFERARDAAERGLFVLGTIILLGGTSAYLSLSPLLAGLTAGLLWKLAPGHADRIIRQDLQKVHHPLVVLLLLAAGASFTWSPHALWLFAPFVIFRIAGKLAGGWAVSKLAPGAAPADLGAHLLAPGVLGIAFALNFLQVSGSNTGAAIVSAVAAGSIVCEMVALVAFPAATTGSTAEAG